MFGSRCLGFGAHFHPNHFYRSPEGGRPWKISAFSGTTSYLALSEDEIEHIDQFLFRFAKLRDTIGEKLFISILEYLQEENPKSKPFIDINRLEQIELLEDKNNWLVLRKISNNIAHQYEDEPKQASEALNAIYNVKPMLETIYLSLKRCYIL